MDMKLIIAGVCTLAGIALLFKPMLEKMLTNLQAAVPKELFEGETSPLSPPGGGMRVASLNKELDSLKVLVDGVDNEEERAFLVDKVGVSLLRKHMNKGK